MNGRACYLENDSCYRPLGWFLGLIRRVQSAELKTTFSGIEHVDISSNVRSYGHLRHIWHSVPWPTHPQAEWRRHETWFVWVDWLPQRVAEHPVDRGPFVVIDHLPIVHQVPPEEKWYGHDWTAMPLVPLSSLTDRSVVFARAQSHALERSSFFVLVDRRHVNSVTPYRCSSLRVWLERSASRVCLSFVHYVEWSDGLLSRSQCL